jgi:hypothetical protein
MTVLSIIQDVAKGTGVIDPPTAIISSTDPAVEKFLRLSNKVGKRLMKVFAWQILRKEQTFTSVATEEQTSILPSDFDRIVKETFWDRTTPVKITGPASPSEWQGLKARSYSDTSYPKFAYRGDGLLVIPTLAAGKSLAFEYVSKNWCQDSGSTGQTAWAADTDTGILDEELLTLGLEYVYLEGEGLPSNVAAQDFQDYYRTLTKNENPTAGILNAGDIFGTGRHYGGVPGGV